MARLNWDKARRDRLLTDPELRTWKDRRADLILSTPVKPVKREQQKRGVRRVRSSSRRSTHPDVWIVSHATGKRVVHHYKTLAAAHAAGFNWAL